MDDSFGLHDDQAVTGQTYAQAIGPATGLKTGLKLDPRQGADRMFAGSEIGRGRSESGKEQGCQEPESARRDRVSPAVLVGPAGS
jgi:hypothetical protein